jgi:uncharacterized membrane protein YkoI
MLGAPLLAPVSMTVLIRNLLLASVLGLSCHALPALADAGISPAQAAAIAQSRQPGRVLAVRQHGDAYRVKILSEQGDLRIVVIDANSGKVMSGR